jgi:asparagine synthase (glutamine-hydrolysing)
MCGITGVICFNSAGREKLNYITGATQMLEKRGPDHSGIYTHGNVALGHRRLSIIDVSELGSQPMHDETEQFTIVYNGEIYNYRELRNTLQQKGYVFRSNSDTEVLLKLYMEYEEQCLKMLNGFFAFAIYDKQKQSLFIARDRMGIKPLLYYKDEDIFIFASEMKAILSFNIKKEINPSALLTFLQLNYIPAPLTILKNISKLHPGCFIKVDTNGIFKTEKYFNIDYNHEEQKINVPDYESAQKQLRNLLDESVQKRLISDVPLGTFLSGGIDSSVISFLASRHSPYINTFSIGFKDEPFFDETRYAAMVSEKIKTTHTVYSLTNDELFENLFDILDYIDEPFADSSAIAVYILCKQTKNKVTVALSGDGADEMLGGYNKHAAEYKARYNHTVNRLIQWSAPVLRLFPQSRNSKTSNFFRQLNRYADGISLNARERYWRWCSYTSEKNALELLSNTIKAQLSMPEYLSLKSAYTRFVNPATGLNDLLYADLHLVLPNDMLQKVDLMSMANGLEVRVPFLDHRVVKYVFSLPSHYKIDGKRRKKILIDAFKNDLPDEIFTRPKHGFEVPLLKWFRNELYSFIFDEMLEDRFVESQNIFNAETVKKLKMQLLSDNPADAHAQIWGLLVFQYWWKKYFC